MPTGSTKSLHFQGFDAIKPPKQQPKPGRLIPEIDRISSDAPAPDVNPLLAMGNLMRDHQLIGQKLRTLHLDETAYHGNLQVVLTALYRMQTLVVGMIEQCERS